MQTMRLALDEAAAGLRAGQPPHVFLDRVKSSASFSGMRKQLQAWLDELELPRYLQIASSAALWTPEAQHLLHPTSCIRYPVLKNGRNYSGSGPEIIRSQMLLRYVEDVLAPELGEVPDALVIPLGKRVDDALTHLSHRGDLDPARVLTGFPHASGANGHRHRQWQENRDQLARRTADWFA
jgi:hypothetical protein